jgi:hypothetical protein
MSHIAVAWCSIGVSAVTMLCCMSPLGNRTRNRLVLLSIGSGIIAILLGWAWL